MKIMRNLTYENLIKMEFKLLRDKTKLIYEKIELSAKVDALREKINRKDVELYELRKTCQCRECRFYHQEVCCNSESDNTADFMSPYSSCKWCER